jgi:hypothetical protein
MRLPLDDAERTSTEGSVRRNDNRWAGGFPESTEIPPYLAFQPYPNAAH